MTSTTVAESNKLNHTLLSWIAHLKHDNDSRNKSSNTTADPVVQKETSLPHPLVNVNTPFSDYLPKERESNISLSNINNKRKHLMHFHRPHCLLFLRNTKEKQDNKQDSSFESKLKLSPTLSSYFRRRSSTSTNDADDEETTNDDDDSTRSIDGTKRPSTCQCYCCHNSPPEPRSRRESSVRALPADLDSPETGFKQLREDGYLEDLDDASSLLLEQEIPDNKIRVCSRVLISSDLVQLALNGLFQSPLPLEGKRHVLHVGCGDGTWGKDTANLFPQWLVVGIDDKTGGPCLDQRKVPRNFKYIRCYYNLLKTLKELPGDSFELVYARFLFDVYGEEDYKVLIKECHRICKPNGYIEFYELDMRIYGSPKTGPITHDLNAKVLRSFESFKLNPRLAREIGPMISSLTGSHISGDDKKSFDSNYTSLPLGLWGGRLGVLLLDSINELFLENLKLLKQDLNDTNEWFPYPNDTDALEVEFNSQKAFMNLHHTYARKSVYREGE